MRRFTALGLAFLVLLLAACGRQAAVTGTSETAAAAADDMQIALPEMTQAVSETQPSTETTTAPTTTMQPSTTTQPPATTSMEMDEAELHQPPESGSVPFTAKYVRISRRYESAFEPTKTVVDSRDNLESLLAETNAYSGTSPQEEADAYTDDWFGTHRLIVIALQESSGSIRHNVQKVTYTGNGAAVKIKRMTPQVQTCDVAHWLILIELPDVRLHGGDPVELIWK